MISFKEVTFKYPNSRRRVFDGFSFGLEQPGIYGLLGENGSGKSTLLYLMTGLLRPRTGQVTYNGVSVAERRLKTLSDIYLMPEEPSVPKTSLKYFVKTFRPFYKRFSDETLRSSLDGFGMGMDVDLRSLSMGHKKKVMICFALATGVPVLLMDEPTNGLDIPSKSQFRRIMASAVSEEQMVVISTHLVHDVEQLLDRMVILRDSQVKLDASTAEISDRYAFRLYTDAVPEKLLYSQSSALGTTGISLRKADEEETQIDMELLFNAINNNHLKMTCHE
ncbi:MAG: ABC transporter ATP-binding protein [Bacteroidaceae bacterium]|nr:ABC transporter ATP-binding protein [Bacteroidaceae bacterium]